MKKHKISIWDNICLFLFLFVGSMVTYFAMNLFWSDIANYENSFNFPLLIATFPLLMFAIAFVTFAIFFVRYLLSENNYRKHLVKHYSIIFSVYNFVGLITSILSATFVYGSFMIPCPFPGSLIVYTVLHTLMLAGNIFLLVKVSKAITEADLKVKLTVKYVFYTIFISIFTFIAFDRSGAAFISPIYIEWAKLDITWFFYLSLFLPMAVLVTLILYKLKHLRLDNYKARSIVWGIFSAVSIALCAVVIFVGMNDPQLVSLISPAMPIERLATIPIDFIILYVPVIAISVIEFVISLTLLIKGKKA